MKKHATLLVCAFIFFSGINAQSFLKSVGGAGNDVAYCIAQATDGGFVLAGDTYSFGLTKSDVLVAKFDASGNLLWNKRYGSSDYDHAYCITATADGGCAVSGVSGGNTNSLTIVKLNAGGELEWAKYYSASTRNGSHSIVQTPDGGFVIGGYTETYDNGSWGYVLKTDVSGNLEWSKRLFDRSYYPGVQGLVVTKDSGYAMIVNQTTTNAYYDIFLIKLDKTGNFKWAKSIGGTSTDMPTALTELSNEDLAVTGSVFDPGSSPQSQFMYVFRTDKDGNFKFARRINGQNQDLAKGIVETGDGNLLITGSIASPSGTRNNLFATKISDAGEVLWTKSVADDINSAQATRIIKNVTGDYAISGYTGNSGAQDFLLGRFDSSFLLCNTIDVTRTVTDFGEPVTQTVKVSNAPTSAFTWSIALIDDAVVFNSLCEVLPLKILLFTAAEKNNSVLLHWITAEEINTSSIEIYRSNDGNNYSLLSKIAAKSLAGNPDYSYVDNAPFAGKNFYKLKFINNDGKYFSSEIRMVDIYKVLAKIFPNPVEDRLNVQLNDISGNIKLLVYSADGRMVINKSILAQNNSLNIQLDLRQLAPGMYSLNIVSKKLNTQTTFIKQ